MLGCIHHVQWLLPAPEGRWRCNNCKAPVTRKDVYPRFDELGEDFARRWELHEKGEPVPPPYTALPATGGLTRH
jgi:hypothetical protein